MEVLCILSDIEYQLWREPANCERFERIDTYPTRHQRNLSTVPSSYADMLHFGRNTR